VRDDPRGQKLPEYLSQLAEAVTHDNHAVASELQSLTQHVDRIKLIVDSQQRRARPSGIIETFDIRELVDDALRISSPQYEKEAIEVIRRFDELPRASLDRHKVLQILIVLLANARDAVMSNQGDRTITVHARRGEAGHLEIAIDDNGCGIEPAHLNKVFSVGFTTKPDGHGLGLHYSACAASELKGNLTAHSEGVGRGASFVLALPMNAVHAA